MDSRMDRQLQLGLLLPRQADSLPPMPVLAARAGWQALWVPAGAAWPGNVGAAGMRIGWILEQGEVSALAPISDVWIRDGPPMSVVDAVASIAPHHVSVDAPDAGAAAVIRSAGAMPVFGPAPLQAHARLSSDPGLQAEAEAAPCLVGTLEDCQQTVAALYAAGMRELRLRLPATPDIPDVIAQMSTLRGEALRGLDAGSPRSPAPAAPTSWGGRP